MLPQPPDSLARAPALTWPLSSHACLAVALAVHSPAAAFASPQATRALREEIEQAESLRASLNDASPQDRLAVGVDTLEQQRQQQQSTGKASLQQVLEVESSRRIAAEEGLEILRERVRTLETQLDAGEVVLPVV